jgi:hypothetical protein
MRVEQAVYGEIPGRGHGLRTSSTNAPIAAAIASKLDLPDVVPPASKLGRRLFAVFLSMIIIFSPARFWTRARRAVGWC